MCQDGAVLVVAADSGAQAQTREHILLARETGIRQIVVYLNKCDMLGDDPDLIDMAEGEVRELLKVRRLTRTSSSSANHRSASSMALPTMVR